MKYINLSHRVDRREKMEVELKRVGIPATRFEAINTKDESWNIYPFQVMYNRTRGAIGCMLSQMTVMKDAYESGKGAMVLEDDLVIGTDAIKRLDYIENFINTKEPEFDIVFLGGTMHCNPAWWHRKGHEPMLQMCDCNLERDFERLDDAHMVRGYGIFSTHAYLIRHESIPKIINILNETMHFSIGIDYSLILHQPKLKCFAFLPGLIKQYNAVSDIGDGVTFFENFSKLNGTIENSAYWWQDKMEDFDMESFNWAEAHKR